ncbi:YdiU family protein [Francisellaceae bacterium]|nr:YdiU family protein [Francisellaceae bacterium]
MKKNLDISNHYTDQLPADPTLDNHIRTVKNSCYSYVTPSKAPSPKLISHSKETADILGLSDQFCKSETFPQIFSGNQFLKEMKPYACCYGGHQFGNWAGQLGDGRAINLGEASHENKSWTLQLKGAGPTPYSRGGDGYAVMRSSIREFLCSEAMYHLGIPTTRALSLVSTGKQIPRDMFYDGHPKYEPGAIVCRVSPSFIRFGNFEIHTSRQEKATLVKLIDFTIENHFPHLGKPSQENHLKWFDEVCSLNLEMVVHWMRVGFVHGVMNTDNMSILGLTIDYGPYGWLEGYDPIWTPNTTDKDYRRYCYSQQPSITLWNLTKLAQAISPVIKDVSDLAEILEQQAKSLDRKLNTMHAQKLGLESYQAETDKALIEELFKVLEVHETDFTLFFRGLSNIDKTIQLEKVSDAELITPIKEAYYLPESLTDQSIKIMADWLRKYITRLQQDSQTNTERKKKMDAVNPKYILRNYLVQLAIDAAEAGDNSKVDEFLELSRHPYDERLDKKIFAKKRPEWARNKAGCSILSCSS